MPGTIAGSATRARLASRNSICTSRSRSALKSRANWRISRFQDLTCFRFQQSPNIASTARSRREATRVRCRLSISSPCRMPPKCSVSNFTCLRRLRAARLQTSLLVQRGTDAASTFRVQKCDGQVRTKVQVKRICRPPSLFGQVFSVRREEVLYRCAKLASMKRI